jgi:fluoroacetyl-CoA thioesterase
MKKGLAEGAVAEVRFTVTPEMCPAFDYKIVHEVCSTREIVHHMEVAGRKMLTPYLEPNEEGVGSHASCDHTGPALVESEVRIVARAVVANERELVCDCTAYRGDRLIATGKTVQRIFPREVLERILRRK